VEIRIPAFTRDYRRAHERLQQLRQLDLAALIDQLFPLKSADLAGLRAVALEALVHETDASGLLRKVVEAITQDEVPQNPDFVRIMSLHKSKGLTSKAVYIVGAVEGVLPTIRDDAPAAAEAGSQEGRRLFYVAVTRAANELVISNSSSMDLADANARGVRYHKGTIRKTGSRYTVKTIATQYLDELGPVAPKPITGDGWLANRA
jgi:superfamily I DNA/RNA helicase